MKKAKRKSKRMTLRDLIARVTNTPVEKLKLPKAWADKADTLLGVALTDEAMFIDHMQVVRDVRMQNGKPVLLVDLNDFYTFPVMPRAPDYY